jgi:hypothetical protein
VFGYTREYKGATNFGEFISAIKRIIRDGECNLGVARPDMFARNLKKWRAWVDEHGNDQKYPGAMMKKLVLRSMGEKSPKHVHFPTMFVNPDKFLRMVYSTPDGRAIHGRPNAIFKIKPQLRSGKMGQFPLKYPDMKGTECVMVRAYINLAKFRRHLGLGETPGQILVVTVMNDFVKQAKRNQDINIAEIASSEEVVQRLADKEEKDRKEHDH